MFHFIGDTEKVVSKLLKTLHVQEKHYLDHIGTNKVHPKYSQHFSLYKFYYVTDLFQNYPHPQFYTQYPLFFPVSHQTREFYFSWSEESFRCLLANSRWAAVCVLLRTGFYLATLTCIHPCGRFSSLQRSTGALTE